MEWKIEKKIWQNVWRNGREKKNESAIVGIWRNDIVRKRERK